MMKKLNKFVRFDCQAFLAGKVIQNLNAKPWTDCETKEILGTVLEVVIVRDHTDYHLNSDEQQETTCTRRLMSRVAKIDLRFQPARELSCKPGWNHLRRVPKQAEHPL